MLPHQRPPRHFRIQHGREPQLQNAIRTQRLRLDAVGKSERAAPQVLQIPLQLARGDAVAGEIVHLETPGVAVVQDAGLQRGGHGPGGSREEHHACLQPVEMEMERVGMSSGFEGLGGLFVHEGDHGSGLAVDAGCIEQFGIQHGTALDLHQQRRECKLGWEVINHDGSEHVSCVCVVGAVADAEAEEAWE